MCLQSGFVYAGVQYSKYCGSIGAKLCWRFSSWHFRFSHSAGRSAFQAMSFQKKVSNCRIHNAITSVRVIQSSSVAAKSKPLILFLGHRSKWQVVLPTDTSSLLQFQNSRHRWRIYWRIQRRQKCELHFCWHWTVEPLDRCIAYLSLFTAINISTTFTSIRWVRSPVCPLNPYILLEF